MQHAPLFLSSADMLVTSEYFHLLATFLFRGKILTGGYVMKIISKDPPLIKTTYITHVDLQGIYSTMNAK